MAVQHSVERTYYPSLAELLTLPVFRGSRVLGGEAGLETPVIGVNLSDTPEYYRWLSAGELMVTTCYAIRNDPEALAAFLPTLAEKGMAGLCVKAAQYLGAVPPEMTAAAQTLGFPLVLLPEEVRFADIIKAVSDEVLRRQTALMGSVLAVNKMLTRTIVEGADLEEIAGMVCSLTGSSSLILDCINNRRALHLTESAAPRFSGMETGEICAALVAEGRMHVLEVGGYSFGFLYLYNDPAHPAPEPDEGMLAQVLQTIPLEISRERTVRENGSRLLEDFLLHLLSDKLADEEREYARAAALGMNLRENHLVIRARLQERPEGGNKYAGVFQQTLLANEVRSTLVNLGMGVRRVHSGGEQLLLLSSTMDCAAFTAAVERFPRVVERLNRTYTALHITAGCGRPHGGIAGLRQSDHEARAALRAAQHGAGLLLFGRLGLLRLLYAADPEEESGLFVQETLGRLLGQPKGQELLRTLESYVRNFGNLKRVSEELFTHYNTVVYRIKSIQEATGLDLHNAEERFLLELALRLYRSE